MDRDELFINARSLPRPLKNEEIRALLLQVENGDKEAEAKLMIHNIRFVLNIVVNKFQNIRYDKKELVSIANIGLLKAIRTFDVSRNIKFVTYADKCIVNEILMFVRKLELETNLIEFQGLFRDEDRDIFLDVENVISYEDTNFNNCIDIELSSAIRCFLDNISERDRIIMMMKFGFYDDMVFSQYEIAQYLNLSQPYICRIITKNLKNLRNYLIKMGLIEKKMVRVRRGKVCN